MKFKKLTYIAVLMLSCQNGCKNLPISGSKTMFSNLSSLTAIPGLEGLMELAPEGGLALIVIQVPIFVDQEAKFAALSISSSRKGDLLWRGAINRERRLSMMETFAASEEFVNEILALSKRFEISKETITAGTSPLAGPKFVLYIQHLTDKNRHDTKVISIEPAISGGAYPNDVSLVADALLNRRRGLTVNPQLIEGEE